jgi:error-prone DNA polymerase
MAAFTAALLNNWPRGFYHPATIVKDAQRHGLSFRPVDVMHSDWNCKLEQDVQGIVVRLGFRYVRGMSQASAHAIVCQRSK